MFIQSVGGADSDLNAQQLWLLFRVRDQETATLPALAERVGEDRDRLEGEMRDLVARNLVLVEGAEAGEAAIVFHTTPESDAILERVDTVRREAMNRALDGWSPDKHPELLSLVERLNTALAAAAPS